MKIVYIANSCEHVVRPFCDGLYKDFGDDFKFLEVIGLDPARAGIGSTEHRDYIYNMVNKREEAKKLCDEADLVIFAIVDLYYISDRIKLNKPTLYYSERLFKKSFLSFFKPSNFIKLYNYYIKPSKNSNFYLLAASSYASNDFYKIQSFKNKIFKWGYQIKIFEKNIDELMSSKAEDGLDFLWVGRLLKLKHCDNAIYIIKKLNDIGYNARLTIVGYGEEEENLKKLVIDLGLSNNVTFTGKCSIDATRKIMDKANIFLFTSDKREGWGATLNEAMNSGCVCIASKEAGSTDFLIDNTIDGFIYNYNDLDKLFEISKFIVENPDKREKIGREAYNKVFNLWNPDKSYNRLVTLIKAIVNHENTDLFSEGPCSKALPNNKEVI